MAPQSVVGSSDEPAAGVNALIGQAKQELEQMIDMNPQGMLLVKADGQVLRCNRALLAMLGLQGFGDALGKTLKDLFPQWNDTARNSFLRRDFGLTEQEVSLDIGEARDQTLRFSLVGSGTPADVCVLFVDNVTTAKHEALDLEKRHKTEAARALVGAMMHSVNQRLTVISVRAKLMSMALDRSDIDVDEMRRSLDDVSNLTMEIAENIKRFHSAEDFVTEEYIKGLDIMDLEKSSPNRGDRNSVE